MENKCLCKTQNHLDCPIHCPCGIKRSEHLNIGDYQIGTKENNWTEKLKLEWYVNDKKGGWDVALSDVKKFIKTEIIEKIIEEIPNRGVIDFGVVSNYTVKQLKRELKFKWLNE